MILDMVWDHDRTYLFSCSSDCQARSWMPEIGSEEVRVFEGAGRGCSVVLCKGDIRTIKREG